MKHFVNSSISGDAQEVTSIELRKQFGDTNRDNKQVCSKDQLSSIQIELSSKAQNEFKTDLQAKTNDSEFQSSIWPKINMEAPQSFLQAVDNNSTTRGRTMQSQQTSGSQRKRGVLVIKKESINRLNSLSRSPVDSQQLHHIDNSPESHYHSIRANKIQQEQNLLGDAIDKRESGKEQYFRDYGTHALYKDNNSQTQIKKSIIVKKTIGELKREQQNVFYFENNLANSCGPLSSNQGKLISKQQEVLGISAFDYVGRNCPFNTNQPFNHITNIVEVSKISPKSSISQLDKKRVPLQNEIDQYLLDQYDHNLEQRERLRQRMDHSSEIDEIFERQSSNAVSVDVFTQKKFQKIDNLEKNVINSKENEGLLGNQDHSKSQGQLDKVQKTKEKNGERKTPKHDFDKFLNQQVSCIEDIQSRDGLRRQKSDNFMSFRSIKKKSLNHERSQNHLSLNISNKLEVPRVLKAIPNTFCEELL